MPYAHYVLAGLLLLLAYYLMKSCYFKLPVERRLHDHLLNPGFEETGLEPLHFAFKASVGTHFESSIGGESVQYSKYLKDIDVDFNDDQAKKIKLSTDENVKAVNLMTVYNTISKELKKK